MKLDKNKVVEIDFIIDKRRLMIVIGVLMPIMNQKELMRTFMLRVILKEEKEREKRLSIIWLEELLNHSIKTLEFEKKKETFLIDGKRLNEIEFFMLNDEETKKFEKYGMVVLSEEYLEQFDVKDSNKIVNKKVAIRYGKYCTLEENLRLAELSKNMEDYDREVFATRELNKMAKEDGLDGRLGRLNKQ